MSDDAQTVRDALAHYAATYGQDLMPSLSGVRRADGALAALDRLEAERRRLLAWAEHAEDMEVRCVRAEQALRDVRPYGNGMDPVTRDAFFGAIESVLGEGKP